MATEKKLTCYITKRESSNGNVRFTVKITLPGSEVRSKELWERAYVIGKPKYKKDQDKLKKEFHSFIKEVFDEFNLEKEPNDRLSFTMRFGDEYSAWCSVGIGAAPEDWGHSKYRLHCPVINRPLEEHEINFFWNCLAKPILI